MMITSRTVHTVVQSRSNIYASLRTSHKAEISLIMFLQKDRLHSADTTIIAVNSFPRDLWTFLYEVYFPGALV